MSKDQTSHDIPCLSPLYIPNWSFLKSWGIPKSQVSILSLVLIAWMIWGTQMT